MTAAKANAGANPRPATRWMGLAAVARERASEQSVKAATASDATTSGPHLEQEAHLVRLAEVYEERARKA